MIPFHEHEPGWKDWLRNRLASDLPGERAHDPLRAVPIYEQRLRFTFDTPPKPGAVLLLLCGNPDDLWFPLIKRTETGGVHSGQISFPGGRTEAGEVAVETALREAEEEIGIDKTEVEVIGQLSSFHVIPSHYLVDPIVGVWKGSAEPIFHPDSREVASVFRASVRELVADEAIRQSEITVRGHRIQAPHFTLHGEMVWGATAMMLNEFRALLRKELT
ncbi:MAG: NUDIX hydrolase [Cyclobacteriaceae bacterium]